HFEGAGLGRGRAGEGMVADSLEIVRDVLADALAVVVDVGGLAVLDFAGTRDGAAVDVVDALVAEADAQHRDLPGVFADDVAGDAGVVRVARDRKSTRLNSSHVNISYAVFCLKNKI